MRYGWSSSTWTETRDRMGRERDRREAMRYLKCAGYLPLPWQERAHLHDVAGLRVNKYAVCGLGAGKSEWEIHEGAMCAMMNPGSWGVFVAPTYDQLKSILLPRWQDLMARMAKRGTPLSKRYHLTEMYDELNCGGRVYFCSLSKVHNLRGFEFAWVGGDELESVINARLVWDVLSGRVRQKANFREMFGGSTPRGLQGIVELFVQARAQAGGAATEDERRELMRQWYTVRATSEDNPHLPPDYLAVQRATYSKRRWDEEVLAEILKPETGVWPEIDPAVHVIDWPRPWVEKNGIREPNPRFDRSLVYDLAYDAGDQFPSVLVIQRTVDGTCIVVDEFCEDQWPTGKVHAEIEGRVRVMGRAPTLAVCDRAVKDERAWLTQAFPLTDVRWMRSKEQQSILAGIEVVRNRLDPVAGRPKLFIARHLTERAPRRGIWPSLRSYRYGKRTDGTLTPEPYKDNVSDHACDALRMHQTTLYGEQGGEVAVVPRRYVARWDERPRKTGT